MSDQSKLTFTEFKETIFRLFEEKTAWNIVDLNDHPFHIDAVKNLMGHALLYASELAKISQGVATIKDNVELLEEDVLVAAKIHKKGIKNSLPRLD